MNDQKGPYIVEHHVTWAILSDGNVITMGHPMLNQYPGQASQAPQQSAGPRVIKRAEFDEMPHPRRHELMTEIRDGKARLID
jgi:hypothetical protein